MTPSQTPLALLHHRSNGKSLHPFVNRSTFIVAISDGSSHHNGGCSAVSEGCDDLESCFLEHGDCSGAHVTCSLISLAHWNRFDRAPTPVSNTLQGSLSRSARHASHPTVLVNDATGY